VLLCYITDRTQLPGDDPSRRGRLLQKIAEAARSGVDFIQLRERDLSARELETLALAAVETVRTLRAENRELRTRLLVNSRTDVALAVGADGVHLRAGDVSPSQARDIWNRCGAPAPAIIGVSCHSAEEVAGAAAGGADFAVFAPVFEKLGAPAARPAGLDALRQASQNKIPVLALGGVTVANAKACIGVGASGVAGIRLFQENDIAAVVTKLRSLG